VGAARRPRHCLYDRRDLVSAMSAAVHRLRSDEPASRYSPEERTRIMSEARVASVQWKAEQQLRSAPPPPISEVKPDHLAEALARPVEDGLTRYQREGRAAEQRERAAQERRERARQRGQRQVSADWETWLNGEVERRVAEHIRGQRDTTRDLLKLLDQHNEIFEKVCERQAELKSENVALRAELAAARENFASLFAKMTERLTVLERGSTQSEVRVADTLRAFSESIKEIRGTAIIQTYLEEAVNDRRRRCKLARWLPK
jgi:hypothetical protein